MLSFKIGSDVNIIVNRNHKSFYILFTSDAYIMWWGREASSVNYFLSGNGWENITTALFFTDLIEVCLMFK